MSVSPFGGQIKQPVYNAVIIFKDIGVGERVLKKPGEGYCGFIVLP